MEQGFYVYRPSERDWLGDDEHGWTTELAEAACFTTSGLAQRIGARENRQGLQVCVMQFMGDF